MTVLSFKHGIWALALLAGLAACNGGSLQLSGGGIGGTGVSQGPITGFGSIFVNGVEFDTAGATILRDGVAIGESELRIGMVVTVEGSIDGSRGTATTVNYAKDLDGPIGAKPTANTLVVLGQTVVIDNLTRLHVDGIGAPTADDLLLNDHVEVSGFATADGRIRATYIEKKAAGAELELKGTISAVSGSTLSVGALQVDTVNATLIGFGGRAPAVGDYVEVQGASLVGTTLFATTVELHSRDLGTTEADRAEVAGLVTRVTSATDFVVNGQRVQTGAATTYSGGVAADVRLGVQLEVEGRLANGVLVASEVTFKDALELEGNVAAVNPLSGALTITGLPGITVVVDEALTDIDGAAGVGAITVGDHVKVRGRSVSAASCVAACVLALELEVEPGDAELALQGPVDSLAAPIVIVLGVAVDTSSVADTDFSGNGVSGRSSFFGVTRVGDIVKMEGTLIGGVATWQSVERGD